MSKTTYYINGNEVREIGQPQGVSLRRPEEEKIEEMQQEETVKEQW